MGQVTRGEVTTDWARAIGDALVPMDPRLAVDPLSSGGSNIEAACPECGETKNEAGSPALGVRNKRSVGRVRSFSA